MSPPEWQDDPSFDIDFHVRRVAVASPGADRDLLEYAATHMQDSFDRARPLWQYTIVDGLDGGRAALLAKMHHTITDGVGGVRLSAMFLDLEREASTASPEQAGIKAAPSATTAPANEGFLETAIDAITHALRRNLGISRRAATEIAKTAVDPLRVPRLGAEVVEMVRSLLRQMIVTDRARSPIWTGKRSLRRTFEVATIDLEQLKRVANGLGGTVNDAFVTGMAGAAGLYHREKGAEVEELRVSMPVSTREDKSAGGNAFTPTRLLVPVATKDPAERFAQIRERLTSTKRERSLGMVDAFAGVLNALPTALVVNVARAQVETVDFATSNLRGAPWDLYVAGAHILSNHPMGPTGGTAFNATVLSYRGNLDLGLNIDTAAIDDPHLLRECVLEAFDELLALNV